MVVLVLQACLAPPLDPRPGRGRPVASGAPAAGPPGPGAAAWLGWAVPLSGARPAARRFGVSARPTAPAR